MSLLIFIVICFLFFLLAKGVKKGIERSTYLKRTPLHGLGRILYYMIFFLGVYIALDSIGIDLTGIAVIIGALSVGIGFGLQTIFSNFFAGIILLIEKKVRIGDIIQLDSGEVGEVIEVNIRTTLICTSDHQKIVIPNVEMISKKLTNWTMGDSLQRQWLSFSTDRNVEKSRVLEIAQEAAQSVSENAPEVLLTKLSETTQDFKLGIWIDRNHKARASTSNDLLLALEKAFDREDIPLIQAMDV
jgi:small-conductance mechanosensitive channel